MTFQKRLKQKWQLESWKALASLAKAGATR